jgi:hypothetical protein
MSRLGEHLVREGKLTPAQLQRALQVHGLVGGRLGGHLLELGMIGEDALLEALGKLRSTATVSAAELEAAKPAVLRAIPAKLALRYQMLPYMVRGRTLFIASLDPGDALREDEIAFMTSFLVRTTLALEFRLCLALARHYGAPCDSRWTNLARKLASPARASEPGSRADDPAANPPRPPSPPLPPSAQPPRPVPAPPAAPARPAAPPVDASPALQFIELDLEDLALLRSPSPSTTEPPAADRAAEPAPAVPEPQRPPPLVLAAPEDAAGDRADATGSFDLEALYDDSVDARLDRAAEALQTAEIRDDIGDVLLGFTGLYFQRRALLVARKDKIVGWRAEGEGVSEPKLRDFDLDARVPSVFLGLREAENFWLGPLPQLPANQALMAALGGPAKDCLVLPVVLRGKVVCYLYADNLAAGVAGGPVSAIRRLAGKAGLAFEVYLLRAKIRLF